MSNLAESFALQTGIPISKPVMPESFYPLDTPLDKVILINNFAGEIRVSNNKAFATFPSKIYDYFDEVVDMLAPALEPLGYKFYQIGLAGNPMRGVTSLVGKLSPLQTVYLVNRAALLIDNDSIWSHIRGVGEKPIVQVFGPTTPRDFGLHWKNLAKTVELESHRFGKKPSYQAEEPFKTINLVPPESIVNAVMSVLGLEARISEQTIYIGPEYNMVHRLYEIVPNIVVNADTNVEIPIIRMDYEFNEKGLVQNLQVRKCAIITDKEINPMIFEKLAPHINSVRVEVDKIDPQWIEKVKKLGIPVMWVSMESDEAKLAKLRLDLYDYCLFDKLQRTTFEALTNGVKSYLNKSFDIKANLAKIGFKTNRFVLSGGKKYLSRAHWEKNIPAPFDSNEGEVIDTSNFWEEQRNHWYFKSN